MTTTHKTKEELSAARRAAEAGDPATLEALAHDVLAGPGRTGLYSFQIKGEKISLVTPTALSMDQLALACVELARMREQNALRHFAEWFYPDGRPRQMRAAAGADTAAEARQGR